MTQVVFRRFVSPVSLGQTATAPYSSLVPRLTPAFRRKSGYEAATHSHWLANTHLNVMYVYVMLHSICHTSSIEVVVYRPTFVLHVCRRYDPCSVQKVCFFSFSRANGCSLYPYSSLVPRLTPSLVPRHSLIPTSRSSPAHGNERAFGDETNLPKLFVVREEASSFSLIG